MFICSYNSGLLTFKPNNYVVISQEEEEVESQTHGFGSTEKVEATIVKNYVSNFEIIGGDLPYLDDPRALTEEQIIAAKQARELAIQTLQSNSMPQETPPTGFGTNEMNKGTTSVDETPGFDEDIDDETPDF